MSLDRDTYERSLMYLNVNLACQALVSYLPMLADKKELFEAMANTMEIIGDEFHALGHELIDLGIIDQDLVNEGITSMAEILEVVELNSDELNRDLARAMAESMEQKMREAAPE